MTKQQPEMFRKGSPRVQAHGMLALLSSTLKDLEPRVVSMPSPRSSQPPRTIFSSSALASLRYVHLAHVDAPLRVCHQVLLGNPVRDPCEKQNDCGGKLRQLVWGVDGGPCVDRTGERPDEGENAGRETQSTDSFTNLARKDTSGASRPTPSDDPLAASHGGPHLLSKQPHLNPIQSKAWTPRNLDHFKGAPNAPKNNTPAHIGVANWPMSPKRRKSSTRRRM